MKKKPATIKRSTRRHQIIVLVDGAGNYYEFSRATFERSRVEARRKREVEKKLKATPGIFEYINAPSIPGSIAAPPFVGGQQLHYAGFYLTSTKPKR
jgi:hypothetical protein